MTLRAEGVHLTYPGSSRLAIDGVDLALDGPGVTALVGPNGSGKSTLLALLAGLLRPSAGQVLLDGAVVGGLPRMRVARRIAYLPARPHVPADYTALELVLMGRHPSGRGLLLERPADVERGRASLAEVGAGHLSERVCDQLSSGERQRVLLARVLCQEAPILLLDEPTSAQDPAHAQDLFGLFARRAEAGATVVLATHDLNAAARHAGRLVVLEGGRGVAQGPPAEVLDAELLGRVFSVDALIGDDEGVPYAIPRRRRA